MVTSSRSSRTFSRARAILVVSVMAMVALALTTAVPVVRLVADENAGAKSAGTPQPAAVNPAPQPTAPQPAGPQPATATPAPSTPGAPTVAPGALPSTAGGPARVAQPASSQTPVPSGRKIFRPPVPPAQFTPPTCHVELPDYDWGSALQGELIKHSYIVYNKGGSPLTITQVKPSCGCTMASKPEKPIEPGQTGNITLEIDTKRLRGPIKKTADVFSNASPTPVKLSFGGKVELIFAMEPEAPSLSVVRGQPVEPTKVVLRRSAKQAFKVKELKTESKVVKAQLSEVQAGEVYEVGLTADLGTDQRKYYNEEVIVRLDVDGKDLDIPLRVQVTVKDRIDIQPRPSVFFNRTETKALGGPEPVSKVLDIKGLGGPEHTFHIAKTTVEQKIVDAKLETVTEGKHYRLTVSLLKTGDGKTQTRTLRDKIILETDDPTMKELTITVLAQMQ